LCRHYNIFWKRETKKWYLSMLMWFMSCVVWQPFIFWHTPIQCITDIGTSLTWHGDLVLTIFSTYLKIGKKTFIFYILYQGWVYIFDTLDSFIFISMSMWHKSLLLTYRVAKTPLILFPKTIIQLCWHRLFQAAVASTRRKLTNIRLFKNNSGFGKQFSHVEK